MRKQERQRWIAKIIKENDVAKQEELVALLISNNIPVTQATVSRDIKEMKLIKVQTNEKNYKYSLPNSENSEESRLVNLLRKTFVDTKQLDKLISVVTKPGSGFALGSLVEATFQESVFTVMSNDDRILIFAKSEKEAEELLRKIKKIVE